MWVIDKVFEDYTHPTNKGWVKLNPDSPLHPSATNYPLTWSGSVSGQKVEIIQKGHSSSYVDDFVFKTFPDRFLYIQQAIVDWIDEKFQLMGR